MSLSFRLAVAMISLVVLTAFGVGAVIYQSMKTVGQPLALQQLQSHAGLMATRFASYVDDARRDVVALAMMPDVVDVAGHYDTPNTADRYVVSANAGGQAANHSQERLIDQFAAIMRAKPNYLQLRLIASVDGREVVRVDRRKAGGRVSGVPDNLLQNKAHRPYFAGTLALATGGVYVSPVNYNRENGTFELPYVPTIRMATPVRTADGRNLGLVIINLDMRPVLGDLEASSNNRFYLVDEKGNYLAHPDHSKTFGFELGTPYRIQNDWPKLAALIARQKPGAAKVVGAGGEAFFAAVWPERLAGTRRVAVIEMAPVATVLAEANAVTGSSLVVAVLAALVAALVATALGLSLARPLQQTIEAVSDAKAHRPVNLPVNTTGEIGALAQAFFHYLEQEALLVAVIGSSSDAIVTKSLDGKITSWNPAAERLFGYTAAEAIGADVRMLMPPDRPGELEAITARTARGEAIDAFNSVRIDKVGNPHDVSLTIWPLRDPAGKIVGASVAARDITGQLAKDRRLRQLQAEAAHASRVNAAGQMASALAHELSQPLTAIINFVKSAERILARQDNADENVLAYVKKAAQQSQRAGDVIARLRDFIGNRSARMEPHDINQVVEDGLETALIGLDLDGLNIVRRYAANLPKIPLDRTQILQVVVNLVRNAVEAMQTTSESILTVSTSSILNGVEISVADTGEGISPEERKRLFEPFATTKGDGMGIGLALSRAIVQAHAGTMKVDSNQTGGTIFRFVLPTE